MRNRNCESAGNCNGYTVEEDQGGFVIEDTIALSIQVRDDRFVAATYDLVHGARVWEELQAADLFRTLNYAEAIIGWQLNRSLGLLAFVAPIDSLKKVGFDLSHLIRVAGGESQSLKQVAVANLDGALLVASEGFSGVYREAVWRVNAAYELYYVWKASGLIVDGNLLSWVKKRG